MAAWRGPETTSCAIALPEIKAVAESPKQVRERVLLETNLLGVHALSEWEPPQGVSTSGIPVWTPCLDRLC